MDKATPPYVTRSVVPKPLGGRDTAEGDIFDPDRDRQKKMAFEMNFCFFNFAMEWHDDPSFFYLVRRLDVA